MMMPDLTDSELLRYSRHIMLPEIDILGQQKLKNAHVMVIGLGGLGSSAVLYLASSGVGHITLIDYDKVDLSNIQRQILYTTADVSSPKIQAAHQRITAINPDIQVDSIEGRIEETALESVLADIDAVLDCTDNFTSRWLINRVCYQQSVPLISGAAIGFAGHLCVFDFTQHPAPCYHCLHPQSVEKDSTDSCTESGILAPLVGMIGCLQATEAIKLLINLPTIHGQLWRFNAIDLSVKRSKIMPDPSCMVCKMST